MSCCSLRAADGRRPLGDVLCIKTRCSTFGPYCRRTDAHKGPRVGLFPEHCAGHAEHPRHAMPPPTIQHATPAQRRASTRSARRPTRSTAVLGRHHLDAPPLLPPRTPDAAATHNYASAGWHTPYAPTSGG